MSLFPRGRTLGDAARDKGTETKKRTEHAEAVFSVYAPQIWTEAPETGGLPNSLHFEIKA